jgi:elongation factor P--(R)-beta-lysine ligase
MEPQKRHLYLADFSYPSYTFNKKGVAGRIVRLIDDPEIIQLELDSGKVVAIKSTVEVSKGISARDVLVAGDIVWINEKKSEIKLLAPNLSERELPKNKFDVERSKRWQSFAGLIRSYFRDREFTEVRTPTLVQSPGMEPHLDPFKTVFQFGRVKTEFFLPTSPEFHLKKMLSRGWRKIFEFKECFRNGEYGSHHQPEFLMLEWYRAYKDFESMIHDVKSLLGYLQDQFGSQVPFDEVEVTTMSDLFRKYCEFDLKPSTPKGELEELCRRLAVGFEKNDSWDELFHRVFLEKIEPGLRGPVIVRDFPPSQAALSKINSAGWADRFELYWNGFEIANAFHELNDPAEQRRRFEESAIERKRLGKEPVPIDPEFLEALEAGIPPAVGIALGVERLFLAYLNENDLVGARAFPTRLD